MLMKIIVIKINSVKIKVLMISWLSTIDKYNWLPKVMNKKRRTRCVNSKKGNHSSILTMNKHCRILKLNIVLRITISRILQSIIFMMTTTTVIILRRTMTHQRWLTMTLSNHIQNSWIMISTFIWVIWESELITMIDQIWI